MALKIIVQGPIGCGKSYLIEALASALLHAGVKISIVKRGGDVTRVLESTGGPTLEKFRGKRIEIEEVHDEAYGGSSSGGMSLGGVR